MKRGNRGKGIGWGIRSLKLSGLVAGLLAVLGGCQGAPLAFAAEPPPLLWGKDPVVCATGLGAGQCSTPRGVDAGPSDGHIFVADQGNRRINEFNAFGQFIKAWGWGVDTGAGAFQICTQSSSCQAGSGGGGAGQFGTVAGIAVDSVGRIYVADKSLNRRVQKFDRSGSFLLAFGRDVNKTKVEEGASQALRNICTAASGDVCQGGVEGTGNSEFAWPLTGDYIVVDDNSTPTVADDVIHVGDVNRIQVFDSDGSYQSQCAVSGTVQSLDVDAAGNLYAILAGSIRKLSPPPACTDITPPEPSEGIAAFEIPQLGVSAPTPTAVAVDARGHVYAFGPANPGNPTDPIFEFDPEGKLVNQFGKGEFSASTGMATNLCAESEPPGNLYVTNASSSNAFLHAYGTEPIGCFKARTGEAMDITETTATLTGLVNPSGLEVTECFFEYGLSTSYGQTASCVPSAGELGEGTTPVPVEADIAGLGEGAVYHFRLVAKVGGETETGVDKIFKTLGPPVISDDHTATATDTEATLKALINPEGFPATYRVEYIRQADFEPGFAGAQSTLPSVVGADRKDHTVFTGLDNLIPGTAYVWRIVADNTALAGGGTTVGQPHTLHTYRVPLPDTDCSNQVIRTGAAAFLPDCRAYEMVSPPDKNGGDIIRRTSGEGDPGNYVQAALNGNSVTYSTNAPFGELESAFNINQYLAARRERGEPEEGWSNRGINIPVSGQEVAPPGVDIFGAFRYFMGFTPDLCSAWLIDYQTPAPTADGQEGYPNLYRRGNCEPAFGDLEALVSDPPYDVPEGTAKGYVDPKSVQGYSADGRHVLFAAQAKLTDEAPAGTHQRLYDRFGGALHLVSILPTGVPATLPGELGSGWVGGSLDNAVSEDGSRVYWTSGKLYLRLHPEQGKVAGECTDNATTACTIEVSSSEGIFIAGSADGSKALYSEGKKLFEFDLGRYEAEGKSQASHILAEDVMGVAGAAESLSRVYFVSEKALPGSGLNSEEDEALEGEPNLYLAEGGKLSFVGTLVAGDVGGKEGGAVRIAYSVIAPSSAAGSYEHSARVSADGSSIAFQSRAPLTGYENLAAEDGRRSVEVFLYRTGELHCVSCNPSGARPRGVRDLPEPYVPFGETRPTKVPAAAWIPTWEHPLHASHVLSADGSRLFFNSNDPLVLRDTNGAQDVYEWEGVGTGGCEVGDTEYFAQNGGCIHLISTGKSASESEFWDASADGEDVFFTTASSLWPPDPGSVDLYDARVGGGFSPPPSPKEPCEGEACQSPPPPPEFGTPASFAYSGPGSSGQARKRCPKGKRKVRKAGKTRCVRRKGGKPGRGASNDRSAVR